MKNKGMQNYQGQGQKAGLGGGSCGRKREQSGNCKNGMCSKLEPGQGRGRGNCGAGKKGGSGEGAQKWAGFSNVPDKQERW